MNKNNLFLASERGYYKIVKRLVQSNTDANMIDNEEVTALYYGEKN